MNAPFTTKPSTAEAHVYEAPALQAVQESVQQAAQAGSAVSLQCTLAAASDAVRLALEREGAAEGAALSLAQRETLDGLRSELRAASETLDAALQAQERRLTKSPPASPDRRGLRLRFRLPDRTARAERHEAPSWWFALTEAIETLGEGVERLDVLASGQPEAAPSRAVAEATAQLLRDHHTCLLRQADRWLA